MTVVLAFNGDPVREEDTGFLFVERDEANSNILYLKKIVKAFYLHPREDVAVEGILIPVLEERNVKKVHTGTSEGAIIHLLFLNQQSVEREIRNETDYKNSMTYQNSLRGMPKDGTD